MHRALLAVAWLATGCLTPSEVGIRNGYEPPVEFAPGIPQAVLLEAARVNAMDQFWTVVRQDQQTGELVLLTPEAEEGEARSRARWTFTASDGLLRARFALEVQFEPPLGVWVSDERICDDYTYFREHQQLDRVVQQVRKIAFAQGSQMTLR